MVLVKLFILSFAATASCVAGQLWVPERGKFGDICDSNRPCNTDKNLVCTLAGQSFGGSNGRCECKTTPYNNAPWIYIQALDSCQDPSTPNLHPHHHYNPNQPQPQPQPPFGGGGGSGGHNGGGFGGGGGSGGNNGGGFGGNNGGGFGGTSGVGTICQDNRICIGLLGSLSRCNYNRCQCYDTESQGRATVGEYNGKCWKVFREGEACTDDPQCILGGSNLRCVADSSNSYLKHCKCQGRGCRNGAAGSVTGTMLTSITLGLIAVVANKIML